MIAWAVASGLAFGAKQVTDRDRPRLPALGATPKTSSMPSSHTAGAVAYAVAATKRRPAVGAVVVPVAATVGWSRVATGRHFPTDVAVGVALGAMVGTVVHLIGRHIEAGPPAKSPESTERVPPR